MRKPMFWATVGVATTLSFAPAHAITILNPQDPSNFDKDGTQPFAPGNVLTLDDTSVSDFVTLYAYDADAAAGRDIDVVAAFQVRDGVPTNADVGNRVVINDGQTRSAIAACIYFRYYNPDGSGNYVQVPGVGLLSQGSPSDQASYPAFVPVDWHAAPVRIRLRRYANGDAELVEVNGVAPSPRALLTADEAPAPTHGGFPTVEFGTGTEATPEATSTVEYIAFRSVSPFAGPLVEPTTLSVANASGAYGGSTDLRAILKRECDGTPMPNATVSFALTGISAGSATTDRYGVAVLRAFSLAGIAAGTYPSGVAASFAGDASSQAAGSTGSLSVGIGDTVVGCDTAALIAAIDGANTAGGGTLDLSFGCTYTLTQPAAPDGPDGLPPITTAITIHGNGATITRGGPNPPWFRIFEVGSTGKLAIDQLTVSGGYRDPGGGILNAGTVTVNRSTISGNASGDGGGIFNAESSELTVTQSTISGNGSYNGGGIFNAGTVTVDQSTISSNTGLMRGGGIFNAGTVTVTRSTNFSYPNTDGGIYNSLGTMTVTQSTISGNFGGIGNDSGSVTLTQSIVAQCIGPITDGGYNLEPRDTCAFSQSSSLHNTDPSLGPLRDNGGPTFTQTTSGGTIDAGPATCFISGQSSAVDQRGVPRPQFSACDIGAYEFVPHGTMLSVANSSGVQGSSTNLRATLTRDCDGTPVSNSAVAFTLNGISVGSATTNGSGVAVLRLASLAGIDPGTYPSGIGASFAGDWTFQAASSTGPLVVAISDSVVGCDTAALIAAIDSANTMGGGTLDLSSGCTYTLTQPATATPNGPDGLPPITTAIAIHGHGATITRGGTSPPAFRIFEVAYTGALAIDHLTVSGGGGADTAGGGIFNAGAVTVTSSTISGNSAGSGGAGGGIYNSDFGELTVTESTISGNVAFNGGGIVNSNNGTVTVIQGTISGNLASVGGGGIFNAVGTLTVIQSTISANLAGSVGGGIYNFGGTELTLTRTIVANNLSGNCVGSITDGGYNLEDTNACGFSQSTSLIDTDPRLGPLQDNGGPTFTHALLPGSTAIDKGRSAGLTTDQRGTGFPRTFDDPAIPNAGGGDGTDIGAFEVQSTNHAPVARCQNATASANNSCLANASVDNGSFDPDAGDTITRSQNPAAPFPRGTTNVTLTVTDNHGATSSCIATVNVVDTTPPTLSPPPNVNVSTGPGATRCGVVISDATLGAASAGDNCSAVSITRSGVPSGNFFPVGTTTITYAASDGSNTKLATQNVTVVDNTPPTITAPASSSAYSDMNCQARIPNVLPQVSASDNCGTVTLSQSPTAGTLVGVAPHTITVTAKDVANNSKSAQTTFTVIAEPAFTISVAPNSVSRGGSVTLRAAFHNCATTRQALTLKVSLTRPGSTTLMVTLPLTLNGGQSGSLSLPIPIPRSTPTGLYTLTLDWYIGGVKIGTSTAQLTVTG